MCAMERVSSGARGLGEVRRLPVVEAPGRVDAIDHAARVFALSLLERDVLVLLLGATVAHGDRVAHALRLGDLIEALSKGAEYGDVVAAFDDAATLVSFALVRFGGDGPRLDRTVGLDDAFWPRLVGAPRAAATLGPTTSG